MLIENVIIRVVFKIMIIARNWTGLLDFIKICCLDIIIRAEIHKVRTIRGVLR